MTVVLIDGQTLSDGSQQRGIGTFVRRLVAGLGGQTALSLAVLAKEDVRLPEGVARVPLRRPAPARLRSAVHDLMLPSDLGRAGCDLFHSPAQHPPRRSPVPWLHTLHDLTPLTWPHPLLAPERRRWRHTGPRLRDAAAVASVSRFSADEGIRLLGLDPGKLTVIPLGVDRSVFHPGGQPVDPPYLLHVAAWAPHKGFREAVEVVTRLADAGLPHRLVLAGPPDRSMERWVNRAVRGTSYPDRIELAGYVEDLPGLYRGASALLMTSRSEGFGLPVLEAMACGTPVFAFANTALPEVVGDAGVLVADGDAEAMAQAVRRLVLSPAQREELVAAGVIRAAQFRWEDMALAYRTLLESLVL